MFEPFIVMSAPNGARRNKRHHRKIPITAKEIAACAEDVCEAGASLFHIHVRDKKGRHSLAGALYLDAIDAVKACVADRLLIQVTTEAQGIYSRQDQMELVRELKPESVSIALKELCPDEQHIPEFTAFWQWMVSIGILPQLILYNRQDFEFFKRLRDGGELGDGPILILLVIGNYSDQPHKVNGLHNLNRADLKPDFCGVLIDDNVLNDVADYCQANNILWSSCCFGPCEFETAAIMARRGGHIRVGFENNIWALDGRLAVDNRQLVEHAALQGMVHSRRIANADDIRSFFNLNP